MKKISLAAGLARCGGWTLGFFAVLTFGLGIPNDPVSLALGLALGVVAWNELRGGAMLRRLDVSAARLLGCNQLALGVLTVVYACWQLAGSSDGSALRDAIGSSGGPEASELLDRAVGDLGALSAIVSYAVYGTLAIVGALIPGLTAWYYFSRARLVRELRASTPEWALRILAV